MTETTFEAEGHVYKVRITYNVAADAEADMPRSLLEIGEAFIGGHSRVNLAELRALLYHGCKGQPSIGSLESAGELIGRNLDLLPVLTEALVGAVSDLFMIAAEPEEGEAAEPGKPEPPPGKAQPPAVSASSNGNVSTTSLTASAA